MGLEVFEKGLELIKDDKNLIEATRRNLEASKDKERLEIFNKLFDSKEKKA